MFYTTDVSGMFPESIFKLYDEKIKVEALQ